MVALYGHFIRYTRRRLNPRRRRWEVFEESVRTWEERSSFLFLRRWKDDGKTKNRRMQARYSESRPLGADGRQQQQQQKAKDEEDKDEEDHTRCRSVHGHKEKLDR